MFESMDDFDAPDALAAAVTLRRTADTAEAQLLALAAHWADLHAALPGEGERIAVPGMERLVRLAGAGTPEVAEFAPAELGAALGISTFAASCLVGDALELRHRLPRLWARILDGTLQAWRGRKIADHTKILSPEAAAWVDAQVVTFAHKIGIKRVLDLVAAALRKFDPERAAEMAKRSRESRGVWVGDETTNGNRSVTIEADALDVAEFDATVTAIAEALAALGDTDRVDSRRAKAVAVIADAQGTLDLLQAARTARSSQGADGDTDGPESTSQSSPSRSARRTSGAGTPVLYIHLHADAVAHHGTAALARVEGGSPVTAGQVMEWLGRTDMTIQPVLDLADGTAVDAHDAPETSREIVLLRNPCCPFPWCNNLSRDKDMDHITAYVPTDHGGPPGQTGPENLAGLCRRHHRLKTHGGWSYTMPEPGIYLWRSPSGQRYLVDNTGTAPVTTPRPGGDVKHCESLARTA
jgi:hypothetical protein